MTREQIKQWADDPVVFIEKTCVNPENGKNFVLYEEEKTFVREGLQLTDDGRMLYTELCYSAGKKSGKTGLAALIVIYTAVVRAGIGGEINCLANDLEQSSSRVFKQCAEILQASPLHKDSVDVTVNKIIFKSTGTVIGAVANDYEGFSGGNPTLNVYDELAYFTAESSRRLWDEGVPSPARRISFRLCVSTAGFDDEPSPLRDIYDRAMKSGVEIAPDLRRDGNLLCYWTHRCCAPWQSIAWIEEMRRTLRPVQFARLILNRWTSSESAFIDLDQWDACVDQDLSPIISQPTFPVWAGLDLGLKHDSTALITCGWTGDRIRVANHQIFIPRGTTLDIESTAEQAILELRKRFALRQVFYDPWQGIGLAQRLTRAGIEMVEWSQTSGNLGLMAGNLLELIRRRKLICYPSRELRDAISKTVAIENSCGWRLGKAKQSDRVDPVIALAMAALAAAKAGQVAPIDIQFHERAARELHAAARARLGFGSREPKTGEAWTARMDAEDARRSKTTSHRWGARGTAF